MSKTVKASLSISVQSENFDVAYVYKQLASVTPAPGAVVTFTGLVRDFDQSRKILALELEHYPGMTEKSLTKIANQATERWRLQGVTIVHRIGHLRAGDQIVLIAIASAHRKDGFEACEFIMDYLKNDAPFWKKETREDGEDWVEAKQSDIDAKSRW